MVAKSCSELMVLTFPKGPFKYYVIKEVGGWGQKMSILDDLKYSKSSKSWVGGPKKHDDVILEWSLRIQSFNSKHMESFQIQRLREGKYTCNAT